jgi:hypothetical protein
VTDVVRASDADRDRAVASLREHLAQGRLSLAEFTQRMTDAYAATTSTELAELERDLPTGEIALPSTRRRPLQFLVSIFGSTKRSGMLRVSGQVFCLALFGNVDLDLRGAVLEGDTVTVTTIAIFGASDVYVPQGVEVELTGLALFGHKGTHGDPGTLRPGAPLVRVRALALFAGIDTWSVPLAWARRGLGAVIKGIEEGEHDEPGWLP